MKFDITNIDKKRLLKALYSSSRAVGLGIVEFKVKKMQGKPVDSLSDLECDNLFLEFESSLKGGDFYIADYLNGRPLKIRFRKSSKGKVTVCADSYDSVNGIYSFLDIMLKNFPINDILLTKKWSSSFVSKPSKDDTCVRKRYNVFVYMLKNAVEQHNNNGRYWQIRKTDFDILREFDCISKL
jgi:hypothetical protein